MRELQLPRTYRTGSRGRDVRRIQEWLSLRGFGLVVDGDFGAATEFAVSEFQDKVGMATSGVVSAATFEALTDPMWDAVDEGSPRGSLRSRIVYFAKRHLKQHPREIGGQNKGPWVRLYMNGQEGAEWPWCAGFACFVLAQACESLEVEMPIAPSPSCDLLAASAETRGLFLRGVPSNLDRVNRGDFFLARRTSDDWTHVGIVIKTHPSVMLTIEGNTNDDGGREGYEVCRRIRSYAKKDFISMTLE